VLELLYTRMHTDAILKDRFGSQSKIEEMLVDKVD